LFHAGSEVKRCSRLDIGLKPINIFDVVVSALIDRALTFAAFPPCSRLLSILCTAAELFPRLLADVENLVVKDDLEQLLRHLIVY